MDLLCNLKHLRLIDFRRRTMGFLPLLVLSSGTKLLGPSIEVSTSFVSPSLSLPWIQPNLVCWLIHGALKAYSGNHLFGPQPIILQPSPFGAVPAFLQSPLAGLYSTHPLGHPQAHAPCPNPGKFMAPLNSKPHAPIRCLPQHLHFLTRWPTLLPSCLGAITNYMLSTALGLLGGATYVSIALLSGEINHDTVCLPCQIHPLPSPSPSHPAFVPVELSPRHDQPAPASAEKLLELELHYSWPHN